MTPRRKCFAAGGTRAGGITAARKRATITDKELIEQALARGDALERICADVGVMPRIVAEVQRGMDRAVATTDVFNVRPQNQNQPADHCRRQGHPMTPENTYVKPGSGQRECRICKTARNKRPRAGAA